MRLDTATPPACPLAAHASRTLARARARRALRRTGDPAAPARAARTRLRPARAAPGADRLRAAGHGKPLPPAARPGIRRARLLGMGFELPRPGQAALHDHAGGRAAP